MLKYFNIKHVKEISISTHALAIKDQVKIKTLFLALHYKLALKN